MLFLSSVPKVNALRAPVSALLWRQNSTIASSRTGLITISNGRQQPTANHRSISQTPLLQAQITVNVPTMGDSITEGTIVEWCVPPGSHFREGDVLALVETDKVTVDIKAERDGVLIKQLGDVDDTVEVGAGLYILDTDVNIESAVLETNMSEVNESIDANKAGKKLDEVSEPTSKPATRVPSIHFLGKDGWKARLTATESSTAAPTEPATTVLNSDKPNAPSSITQIPYKPMEGRPIITEEEMEALVLGGALEAPEVKTLISDDGLKSVAFVGGKVTTAGPRGVWLAA